jgi:radical SAM superfamily enzyme YgiQ (UPF0313 family)
LAYAKKIIEYTFKKGIITGGFFMIGLPTETLKEIQATVQYAVTGPFDLASFLITTIYPGTALFDELTEDQKIALLKLDPDMFDYYNVSFNLSNVSKKELLSLEKHAYYRFYFFPKRIFRLLRKIRFTDLFSNLIFISATFFNKRPRLFFKEDPR